MALGLFQLASFRTKIGPGEPRSVSLDITGRAVLQCDRISAFLTVEPSAAGQVPALADIQVAERLVRLRLALDRNDRNVLTIGDQPLSVFQQLQGGPVAVPPFLLRGSDQPTIRLDMPPNLFQLPLFTAFGDVYLELVFWGQVSG